MLSAEENKLLTHTGPGTPMGALFRRFWTPVLLSKELPAPDCPPVPVKVLNEELIAFRDSRGRIGLLDAHCRHRRASLFYGRNEECGLRCIYHGWKYDVEGNVVEMPNETGGFAGKVSLRTTAYPTQEKGGIVWAYMGPREKIPEFPRIEWVSTPENHRYVGKVFVDCNYLQAQEGNFDNTHTQFLHGGINPHLARRGLARRPEDDREVFEKRRKAKTPVCLPKVTGYGLMAANRRNVPEREDVWDWHLSHFLMPYTALIAGGRPSGTCRAIMHVPIIDESHCTWVVEWNLERPLTERELYDYEHGYGFLPELIPGTFVPKRNPTNNFLVDRALQRTLSYSGIGHSFFEQDMAMTTSQGAIADRAKEFLGTADIMIIALRRLFLKAAGELQKGIEPHWASNPEAYMVRQTDLVLPKGVPVEEGFTKWMAEIGRRVA